MYWGRCRFWSKATAQTMPWIRLRSRPRHLQFQVIDPRMMSPRQHDERSLVDLSYFPSQPRIARIINPPVNPLKEAVRALQYAHPSIQPLYVNGRRKALYFRVAHRYFEIFPTMNVLSTMIRASRYYILKEWMISETRHHRWAGRTVP